MSDGPMRVERDSLGEVQIPQHALWGAQTQRAVDNFRVGGGAMPAAFIHALALIKSCAAQANGRLGLVDQVRATAIADTAAQIADGAYADQFPVDRFQTGSGTSSNMNMNEVIASLASKASGQPVHANDHVNLGQSSNDVIPSATHVAIALQLKSALIPELGRLERLIRRKARSLAGVVKTGRTHLMDAMPLTMEQELGGWAQQIANARIRLQSSTPRILALALGGTAVGTGINADPKCTELTIRLLNRRTRLKFYPAPDRFEAMSSVDACVELSGQLRVLACALIKISNDLRWMGSGPLAGLGEIRLPALQPGSSIMPGKVNPVIPEAVCMACAQVIGADSAVTVAGQSGNFQLNVMWPLVASNLLESINWLSQATRSLGAQAIRDFVVCEDVISSKLALNPVLVTALNSRLGYERGAAIAKQAYRERRSVLAVALEETDMDESELSELLDPAQLAKPGQKM